MDNVRDIWFTGEAAGDYLGISVSGAGDVNADGFADVMVDSLSLGIATVYRASKHGRDLGCPGF